LGCWRCDRFLDVRAIAFGVWECDCFWDVGGDRFLFDSDREF
jgi:ribosomal protein L37AE/L43A